MDKTPRPVMHRPAYDKCGIPINPEPTAIPIPDIAINNSPFLLLSMCKVIIFYKMVIYYSFVLVNSKIKFKNPRTKDKFCNLVQGRVNMWQIIYTINFTENFLPSITLN